jgi:hypothetical protein
MRHLLAILAAAAGAAATMYYFDPELGARRRASLRQGMAGGPDYAGAVLRRRAAQQRVADDGVLRDRVQQRVSALVSHPGAIRVDVQEGDVRLSGRVLTQELSGLLLHVRDMEGVRRVVNALDTRDDPRALAEGTVRAAPAMSTQGQAS